MSDFAGLSVYSADGRKLDSAPAPISNEVAFSSTDGSKVMLFGSNDFLSTWPSGDKIALPVVPNGNTGPYLSPNGKAIFLLSDAGDWLAQLP